MRPHGSTVVLHNAILVGHAAAIYIDDAPSSVRLEAALWGEGAWANTQDWSGSGVVTNTLEVRGNPAFVAPDNGDYHIGDASAAINRGVNAGVTDDIDGQARPAGAGYDIGADEYYESFYIYLPLVLRN